MRKIKKITEGKNYWDKIFVPNHQIGLNEVLTTKKLSEFTQFSENVNNLKAIGQSLHNSKCAFIFSADLVQ